VNTPLANLVVNGTSHDDVICVQNGYNATINAGDGDDTVVGNFQPQTINGGNGNDWLFGGDETDANLGDTIDGGPGDDHIFGGAGKDTLIGGPQATSGADVSGDDVIFGGDGDDTIVGGGGRDFLNGDAGNDVITETSACIYLGLICPAQPDDTVGSIICGGPGDDFINASGARHQCIDAGPGADSCVYNRALFGTGGRVVGGIAGDVATLSSCETIVCATPPCESPSNLSCGCD